MPRLIYSTIASLDGYVADADGRFDWAEPDVEVFGNGMVYVRYSDDAVS